MKYISSKKLGHADCLLRLISKYVEPFEDTVVAALRVENEIKTVLCKEMIYATQIRTYSQCMTMC